MDLHCTVTSKTQTKQDATDRHTTTRSHHKDHTQLSSTSMTPFTFTTLRILPENSLIRRIHCTAQRSMQRSLSLSQSRWRNVLRVARALMSNCGGQGHRGGATGHAPCAAKTLWAPSGPRVAERRIDREGRPAEETRCGPAVAHAAARTSAGCTPAAGSHHRAAARPSGEATPGAAVDGPTAAPAPA